jgi:secondary thiamine-phosphate synthase enzyme
VTQFTHELHIQTHGKGLYMFTDQVAKWVASRPVTTGLLTIFIQHTSASLTIQENADPDVVQDLNDAFERLAPEDDSLYRHTVEGSDDMPAHIRTSLTDCSIAIPVHRGRLALGTWQGLYVFEHRKRAHRRTVVLHLIGE